MKELYLYLFQIFEKADPADQQLYNGFHFTAIEGETLSNMLYVMFYSDYSINYRGFSISYRHIEGNSGHIPNEYTIL